MIDLRNGSARKLACLLVLLLSLAGCLAHAGEALDLMNVKSMVLKRISNDLNHRIYGYTFLTDAGHGLEIRGISADEKQVLMTETYGPGRREHLHAPYESWFVKLQSEKGKHLIRLVKESLRALPENDPRKSHLVYLLDHMEERSSANKRDQVANFKGEDF